MKTRRFHALRKKSLHGAIDSVFDPWVSSTPPEEHRELTWLVHGDEAVRRDRPGRVRERAVNVCE